MLVSAYDSFGSFHLQTFRPAANSKTRVEHFAAWRIIILDKISRREQGARFEPVPRRQVYRDRRSGLSQKSTHSLPFSHLIPK
jgi:hypothetical protein